MRKSIDTYVEGIAHDNKGVIEENNMTVAEYIICDAENGLGYHGFFDDDELDETGEPSEVQIEELKSYLNEYYSYRYISPSKVETLNDLVSFINERGDWSPEVSNIIETRGWEDLTGEERGVCRDKAGNQVIINDNGEAELISASESESE